MHGAYFEWSLASEVTLQRKQLLRMAQHQAGISVPSVKMIHMAPDVHNLAFQALRIPCIHFLSAVVSPKTEHLSKSSEERPK